MRLLLAGAPNLPAGAAAATDLGPPEAAHSVQMATGDEDGDTGAGPWTGPLYKFFLPLGSRRAALLATFHPESPVPPSRAALLDPLLAATEVTLPPGFAVRWTRVLFDPNRGEQDLEAFPPRGGGGGADGAARSLLDLVPLPRLFSSLRLRAALEWKRDPVSADLPELSADPPARAEVEWGPFPELVGFEVTYQKKVSELRNQGGGTGYVEVERTVAPQLAVPDTQDILSNGGPWAARVPFIAHEVRVTPRLRDPLPASGDARVRWRVVQDKARAGRDPPAPADAPATGGGWGGVDGVAVFGYAQLPGVGQAATVEMWVELRVPAPAPAPVPAEKIGSGSGGGIGKSSGEGGTTPQKKTKGPVGGGPGAPPPAAEEWVPLPRSRIALQINRPPAPELVRPSPLFLPG